MASLACAGRSPDLGYESPNEGEGEGEGEGDTFIPCDDEEDCASLGPGHMCMGGGCMLMEVNAPTVVVPDPSGALPDVVPLTDLDPAPDVFEATLIATEDVVDLISGTATNAWVYKEDASSPARVPGPLIDVEQGTTIKIHFTNDLPEPTSIHWHGLVLPNAMDGAGDDDNGVIQPGASFDFEFVARDASLFWFHPHVRGDVQIERGLYGVIRVREPSPVAVDAERILVLDDILLDDDGQIEPPDDGPAMTPDGTKMTFVGMMGRQGNRLLVNGASNPFIDVAPGSVERWRIVDVANSRFFNLQIPGVTFTLIGTDVGLVPEPKTVDTLLLSPGERYDVLVRFDVDAGEELPLLTRHHDRGHDMADPGDLVVATIRASGAPIDPPTAIPVTSSTIERLVPTADAAQTLKMEETLLRGAKVGFSLNGEMWPDVTPLEAHLGTTETWEIVNATHMDHPFHLHGFPFQVVDRAPLDGGVRTPEAFLAWKDVVIVGPQERLRFVVRYDGFEGMWMFHCHILEHAERGMMSMIHVMP
jgi:FtsP/CotA-like multicopper oxidase with cupredoxin domain